MNKIEGLNREYITLTADFTKKYLKTAVDIGIIILGGHLINKKLIEKKVVEYVTPIINDYFQDSIHASNRIVKKEVSKLVSNINIPFKYNKSLLNTINEKSIYTGYYDIDVKSAFSKKEITALKKTILSAKYSNWSEKEMISAIKNVVKVTDNHARIIGRMETARLDSAAKTIYFNDKKVKDEYDLVWYNTGSNIRPDHLAMAGKKADKNGMFYSDTCGLIPPPPFQCSPFNCKCGSKLVKKI